MMRAIGALWLCATLAAQQACVDLRLAPDAGKGSPAAWQFVRQHVLPELGAWPHDLDPDGALHIVLSDEGNVAAAADSAPLEHAYLEFTVQVGDQIAIRGTCDRDGTERWSLDAEIAARDARLRRIGQRVALGATTGGVTVELSTLTGTLMAGAPHGDRLAEQLMLGSLECGTVDVIAVRETGDDTTWRVLGHGEGGLLLPALFVALADEQWGGDGVGRPARADEEDLERWLLLAATATGDDQLEAARQLSRFDDPRADRALASLRYADGDLRLLAIMGLERSRHRRGFGPDDLSAAAGVASDAAATASARELLLALTVGIAAAIATCLAVRRWLAPRGEAGSQTS